MLCIHRSEDSIWESVFFYTVGYGNWTQVFKLGGSTFILLSSLMEGWLTQAMRGGSDCPSLMAFSQSSCLWMIDWNSKMKAVRSSADQPSRAACPSPSDYPASTTGWSVLGILRGWYTEKLLCWLPRLLPAQVTFWSLSCPRPHHHPSGQCFYIWKPLGLFGWASLTLACPRDSIRGLDLGVNIFT